MSREESGDGSTLRIPLCSRSVEWILGSDGQSRGSRSRAVGGRRARRYLRAVEALLAHKLLEFLLPGKHSLNSAQSNYEESILTYSFFILYV